ncbi:MAG: phosphopantetheine-binding protein [Bacteroidales bacterium]|jgi:acyl carrier protein|nr:phosphopantetheine-binding protein [Bacteroidales bacterium]
MEQLEQKLKEEIITALNLSEMKPDNIDVNAPLFVDGLGLDSIDALELTVLLEKKYGLRIQTSEEGKKVLYSVKSMAEFIRSNNKG